MIGLFCLFAASLCTFLPVNAFEEKIASPLSKGINTWYLVIGYLSLLILAYLGRNKLHLKKIACTGLAGLFSVHILKATVGLGMPRPSGHWGGFPSGHSDAAFILAYLISSKYPALSWAAFGLAGAISWSRVVLHDHWLYQVVGGGLIGLATAVLVENWIDKKQKITSISASPERVIQEEYANVR